MPDQENAPPAYKGFSADFFADAGATEQRLVIEKQRARTPKQRQAARQRPKERTAFIGFRTTPEIRKMADDLSDRLGISLTEMFERALFDLSRNSSRRG